MSSLAESYFRPRAFEEDGRLYRWLGVGLLKRALTRLVQPDPARRVTNGYRLGGHSLDDVRTFERLARRNELIHLFGLAVALAFLLLHALRGGLLIPGLVVFAANFHCYLLQRYNRARAQRILRRATRPARPG